MHLLRLKVNLNCLEVELAIYKIMPGLLTFQYIYATRPCAHFGYDERGGRMISMFLLPAKVCESQIFPLDLVWLAINRLFPDKLVLKTFCQSGRNIYAYKSTTHKLHIVCPIFQKVQANFTAFWRNKENHGETMAEDVFLIFNFLLKLFSY